MAGFFFDIFLFDIFTFDQIQVNHFGYMLYPAQSSYWQKIWVIVGQKNQCLQEIILIA